MKFLSLFLSYFLALNPIWAQSGSGGSRQVSEAALHVHLVDDPGPAQPHTTSTKGYVLQVTSAAGTPVAGAAVALRLPEDGPTGRFANGLRAWVAYSDSAGIAQFPVIEWGDIPGEVPLRVTAARGASHAQFMIAQRIGVDAGSVSVVSVPLQGPASPAKNPPAVDTVVVAVAKPEPARMPEIQLPAPQSSATYKPLADVVPQKEPSQPLPDPTPVQQQPGTVFQPTDESVPSISRSGSSPAQDKPHPLAPKPPPAAKDGEPTVTITNSPTGAGGSESHKKLWLIVGIGGGAAAAALFGILAAHGGGAAGAGSGSTSGVTIGAPTITVGH
jgi:hypothetical protein